MELLFSICMGLGLAAACGFRVFVPLLAMSIACQSGHLELASGYAWVGSMPALITFAVATALEVAAYYIPWLDNFLDFIAAPAAVVAGVIASSSMITDMSPLLTWSVALIGGGGSAAVVHVGTGLVRSASTLSTGGLGNPLVSTLEGIGSVLLSIIAIILPVLAFGLGILFVLPAYKMYKRLRRRSQAMA